MAQRAKLDKEAVISLYKTGMMIHEVATQLHSSFYPIKRIIEEAGIKLHKGGNKKGYTPWNKGKPYLKLRGDKNPNWKGGVTLGQSQRRCHTIEYKNWKRALLERDGECKMCGSIKLLEAHHIVSHRECQGTEKEFDINNGIILCRRCHNTTKYKEHLFKDLLKSKL